MVTIKFNLFLLIYLIFALALFGCADTKNDTGWEDFNKSVPDSVVVEDSGLSEDVLNQLKIPEYSTIPFEVNEIIVTPLQNKEGSEEPLLIDISFIGEEDILYVSNLYTKEGRTLATQETVELSNGKGALWDEEGNAKVLSWHDSEAEVVIDLMITAQGGDENGYTLKDFLKMANSIE